MLLDVDNFVAVLVDNLLVDNHPAQEQPNFEAIKSQVQRDFAEALQQIAVYPRGREVLLAVPTVATSLHEVAERGWSEAAKECARGALSALSDREALADVDEDHRHVMISCASCLIMHAPHAFVLGLTDCAWAMSQINGMSRL